MEYVPRPSAFPCNGPNDSTSETQETATIENPATIEDPETEVSDSIKCEATQEPETPCAENKDHGDENSQGEVIDDCSRSVESETASSKASTSDSEGQQSSTASSTQKFGFFNLLRLGSGMRFQTIPPLKTPKLTKSKDKRLRQASLVPPINNPGLDADLCRFKSTWKNFTLAELKEATDDFSPENLIGEGGCAEVFKGKLEDGQLIAIKRLTRGSSEELTMDYLSELGIIAHVDHPNIAKLIGYGVEGGMYLVLQLSPHGSLASLLHGSKETLQWDIRYRVAEGTAEGLAYLHGGAQRRIIHKDIKAANILLTEDFEPQISDFGLAKWLPDQWTHHTVSKIEGTFGYLPPEFFMHGIVDEKTDVYAYGVMVLELITGRKALDSSQQSLVMWAKPLLNEDSFLDLVDPSLGDAYKLEQLSRLVMIASMCTDQIAANRPKMSQVLEILNGDEDSLQQLYKRQKSKKLQRTQSEEFVDVEEYNSTKYLSDLNRHMEIVFGPG